MFITKGSTIALDSNEMKAVVIEDFEVGVGEQASNKYEASDGTTYSTPGEQDENTTEIPILATDDTFINVLNSVYGVGSAVSGGTEWEMRNAGGSVKELIITSPATTTGKILTYTSVNSKGLVVRPKYVLSKGFEATVKVTCDYWKVSLTS